MLLASLGFLDFTFIDVLDILTIAFILYALLGWLKGSTAMNIFVAIIIMVTVRIIAEAIGMTMLSGFLGAVVDVGAVALIVIFQPEIRKFLGSLGRRAGTTLEKRKLLDRIFIKSGQDLLEASDINELCEACWEMGTQKTGALIIVRKANMLDDVIATGDIVDARISRRLIMNIFFKNSPLHDGAMVIGGGRIIAARCTLPISERMDLPARYGMRHKAAIGMSEQCDADVIVVSEETGGVSLVREGAISPINNQTSLKLMLQGKKENAAQ